MSVTHDPNSEETVFVESSDSLIDTVLQSPIYEQWMLYKSSNDEFSFGHGSDNAEETSSDMEIRSDNGVKRQRHAQRLLNLCENEEAIEEVECNNIMTKRYTCCSYRSKMKEKHQEVRVDVKMIDFAHTSFVHGSSVACNSSSMVHQGPDCGFLTGLDSLRRLLLEILTEN